jgi:2-polyprenyl-3-methyl-5-hydroxy-6-metoxy-1,4-benzoquinol methylase
MEPSEYEFLCEQGDRDWWQVGMRASTLALVPPLPGATALDLGAGCGYVVRDLGARGLRARGVELNEYAAAFAGRLGAVVEHGRLQDHLGPGRELDLITLLDVLPHREVDEDATLVALGQSVRPGGRVLLRLPAYRRLYGRHDRYVHQRRRYDARDVAPLAARAGLEVERTTFANCVLFGAVAAVHVLDRLRGGTEGSSNQRYPGPVNAALRAVLLAEAALIRRGVRLPWGSSLLVLLRRPER